MEVIDIEHNQVMSLAHQDPEKDMLYSEQWVDFADFSRPRGGFVFVHCHSGEIKISIDSYDHTVKANDFMIWGPNSVVGRASSTPDVKVGMLYLSMRFVHSLIPMKDRFIISKGIASNPVFQLDEQMTEIIGKYHDFILARLNADGMYADCVTRALISAFLYEMLQYINKEKYAAEQSCSDILFNRFIRLVNNDKIKHRSVTYYAEQLYVTPKYLSVVCKSKSGQTAMEYINSLVMLDVRRLLAYSNMTLKEISIALGFPNVSFFGKYVKVHTGMTPRELQKATR